MTTLSKCSALMLGLAACSPSVPDDSDADSEIVDTSPCDRVPRDQALWPIVDRPAYDVAPASGTVTDPGTALVWERDIPYPDREFTWQQAVDHCDELSATEAAGYNDWRLPSMIELISTFDVATPGSWVDPSAFPGTPIDAYFWSSTGPSCDAGTAWAAYAGQVNSHDVTDGAQQVRCVRGGVDVPTTSHYTVQSGTVVDNWTGLTWQQEVPYQAKGWSETVSYCAALDLDGRGWRLPSYKELLSVVDYGASNPAWDASVFPSASVVSFWSSSRHVDMTDLAWYVDFGSGAGGPSPVSGLYGARCVR